MFETHLEEVEIMVTDGKDRETLQMGMKTENIRFKRPKINIIKSQQVWWWKTFENYLEELRMVVTSGEASRKIGGVTKQLGFLRFAQRKQKNWRQSCVVRRYLMSVQTGSDVKLSRGRVGQTLN